MRFLKFGLSRQLRLLEGIGRDFAVAEKGHRRVDAAHVEGFAFLGDEAAADDQFGRGAADVDHKALFARRRQSVRAARKHETGLFAAGDDFNGVPERLFGLGQKLGRVGRHA